VCEQVHLPLQAGDDQVLRRMGRGFGRDDFLNLVSRLRAAVPGIAISTDLIVGFPGETDAQFRHTLEVVEEIRFDHAYMFAYSRRQGTAALKLEGEVPEEGKRSRLQELIALQNRITLEIHRAMEGQVVEVLVEGPSRKNPARLTGRTRGGHLVHFPGEASLVGKMIPVRVTRGFTWGILGQADDKYAESIRSMDPDPGAGMGI